MTKVIVVDQIISDRKLAGVHWIQQFHVDLYWLGILPLGFISDQSISKWACPHVQLMRSNKLWTLLRWSLLPPGCAV